MSESFTDWLAREYPGEKAKADAAITKEEANRRNMQTATWASLERPDLVREHAIEVKEEPE